MKRSRFNEEQIIGAIKRLDHPGRLQRKIQIINTAIMERLLKDR